MSCLIVDTQHTFWPGPVQQVRKKKQEASSVRVCCMCTGISLVWCIWQYKTISSFSLALPCCSSVFIIILLGLPWIIPFYYRISNIICMNQTDTHIFRLFASQMCKADECEKMFGLARQQEGENRATKITLNNRPVWSVYGRNQVPVGVCVRETVRVRTQPSAIPAVAGVTLRPGDFFSSSFLAVTLCTKQHRTCALQILYAFHILLPRILLAAWTHLYTRMAYGLFIFHNPTMCVVFVTTNAQAAMNFARKLRYEERNTHKIWTHVSREKSIRKYFAIAPCMDWCTALHIHWKWKFIPQTNKQIILRGIRNWPVWQTVSLQKKQPSQCQCIYERWPSKYIRGKLNNATTRRHRPKQLCVCVCSALFTRPYNALTPQHHYIIITKWKYNLPSFSHDSHVQQGQGLSVFQMLGVCVRTHVQIMMPFCCEQSAMCICAYTTVANTHTHTHCSRDSRAFQTFVVYVKADHK